MSTTLLEHEDIKDLTSEQWLERLLKSLHQPVQHNRTYPGFPDESIQKAFVGSSCDDALKEGYNFYQHLQRHMMKRRFKVAAQRYLDFGSGWGRISRFFLRDFHRGDMVGVDVDADMVSFCQDAAPGGYFTIHNGAPLPFTDASFKLVTAYSVFTHLPETLFRHWLTELLRVTAPGGLIAFTVEPERFLDFMAGVDPAQSTSPWHIAVNAKLGNVEERKTELQTRGITFLPTGGGDYRPPDAYGDTVVTREFVAQCAAGLGEVIEFVDDPGLFWQAVVVIRRYRWKRSFG